MRSFLISFIMLTGFGSVHSQNSFFITPAVNTKLGVCSTNSFFSFSNKNYQNDYFDLYNKPLHFRNSLQLGLGIGYANEKQRFSASITWNQDAVSVANETVLLSTIGENNYYSNKHLNYQFGFTSHRFSLNMNKAIYKDFIHLSAGIGLNYLPQGDENYEFVVDNDPFVFDSTSTLKIKYTTRAVAKTNLNLSLGLNFDIKWNGLYLFTFSSIYTQGLKRNLIVHENYYELTDYSSNTTTKFSYSSASKGSGLLLQVSRNFQLYPRKKK